MLFFCCLGVWVCTQWGIFKGILGGGQYKRSIFSSSRLLHFLTVEWMSILLDRFSCEEIFTLWNPQSSPRLQMSQLRGKQKNQKTENVIAGKWMRLLGLVCLFVFFYWTYHFFLLFQHLPLLSDTCRSACTLAYPAQVHTAVLETRELVVISQCTTSQKKDILDVLTFSRMTKAIIKQRKNQSRDIAQTNQLRQQ